MTRLVQISILVSGAIAIVGCDGRPSRVDPPSLDTQRAAAAAIKQFDSDGDGRLSRNEAAACQGILNDWDAYDLDADGGVTTSEMDQRFSAWENGDTGLMNMRCEVKLDGQPLPQAQVKLTPYSFLGDGFYSAEGETDRYGFAFLRLTGDDVPQSMQGVYGMQVGLYRVEIRHPAIQLPPRYNRQTELSVDLSPADANTGISFPLVR